MGVYFQTIVDRDASLEEAHELSRRIREWLISDGMICCELAECVLGESGMRYAPGNRFEHVVEGPGDNTRRVTPNGLQIEVGRRVFCSGQGGFHLICSQCEFRFEPGGHTWGDAVEEWWEGKGQGMLACPNCGHSKSVTEWNHDPPYGFAYLGFTFWNWPRLKKSFVEEFSRRLGHRIVQPYGKL